MRTKRVYYPINKAKIQEAINLYTEYTNGEPRSDKDESMALWEKYLNAYSDICPNAHLWASQFFQPMKWAGTLTVENVYHAILAMGLNTKLEEVYDDEL